VFRRGKLIIIIIGYSALGQPGRWAADESDGRRAYAYEIITIHHQ